MGDSLPSKDEAMARLEAFQVRLDEAHKKGRAAYDQLFDAAPAGVALHEIDARGHVTRINARELEILGRRRDELVGKPVWQFAVMKEASERAVEKKLAGGGLRPFVRTLTRADQVGITAAFVERYLRNARNEIVGIRTSFMQITGT
ncbi:MAG TPA: PAS domain-containing protein [Vicinamibacteria bacterium]|nr:PAS domain-containing protein [Vicinamibacteria bacterium]